MISEDNQRFQYFQSTVKIFPVCSSCSDSHSSSFGCYRYISAVSQRDKIILICRYIIKGCFKYDCTCITYKSLFLEYVLARFLRFWKKMEENENYFHIDVAQIVMLECLWVSFTKKKYSVRRKLQNVKLLAMFLSFLLSFDNINL